MEIVPCINLVDEQLGGGGHKVCAKARHMSKRRTGQLLLVNELIGDGVRYDTGLLIILLDCKVSRHQQLATMPCWLLS